MREDAGKMRTRITPNTDTFYAVIVSKAFDRSINKAPAKPCLSRHNLHLSIIDNKACSVLNPFLYLQSNGERSFPIESIIYFCIIRSNILETVGRTLAGL